jgi:hypothetical protein
MGHIFIAVNGDNVGESIGNAIISDNHDELSRVSGSIKSAHQMLDQWVQSKGGKIIVSSGDEGIYSLPQQAVNELDAIKQKYASMANTSLTIGVGSSMSEASKALIYGKMNNKDQVVHYEPAVDDYISNDGEAQAEEQAIESELPTEQDVIDQGDASEEGQEGVDDEIDDGQIDGDGEEDNSAIEGEENDPNAEFSQDDEDGLDQDGELADQDEDGLVDDEEEQVAAQASAPQKDTSKNPAAPQAPGKPAPFGKKPAAQEEDTEEIDVPADQVDGDYGSEEMEDAQPEHEQDMGEEEEFIHDAQENRDDELDDDNIEADEEGEFAEDGDENMDAEFDPAEQGDGELSEDGSDEVDQDGMNPAADGSDEDDMSDEDMSEDDEEGFGGVGDEDDIQELGEDEVDQGSNPEEQGSIMSEMLHANMGDEEAEDSDDDIKQDIIESLMQFKTQRAAIEEMKSSNPELYQANIIMLRSMIQMAKKLKMNPERGLAEKGMAQDTQDAFPPAQDDQQMDPAEQNPLLGKSESLQKTSQEGKFAQRQRTAAKRGTEKGVHNRHPQVTYHHDNGKYNEKKTKGTSRVGHMNQEMREGDRHPGEIAEAHNSKLKEMKQMKAPNLPKSEQNMTKKDPCWDGYEKVKGKKDFSEDSCKKITKARVDEGKSPSMKQVARAGRNSRVKFKAGSPAGQHPDTGEHIRARKPGEGDKIVGTPKPRKPDMKAPTKMNKSKVEEIKIDLKKKPDVKKP